MKLQKDIRAFIELLLSEKVDFLLVGGYALAFHGAPRFTEDIELDGLPIWVIGREMLIRNKRATGRTQDSADVERLEAATGK